MTVKQNNAPQLEIENQPTEFISRELEPLQADSPDAIDYFVIDPIIKQKYREEAIATGDISNQDYTDCDSFNNAIHKKNRYELKRAKEILNLLLEVSKHAHETGIDSEISLLLAQDSVTMAALSEACIKLKNEPSANEQTRRFYLECLDSAQADLYTAPTHDTAMQILSMLKAKVDDIDYDVVTQTVQDLISVFKEDYPFVFEDNSASLLESLLDDARVAEFSKELHDRFDDIFKTLKEEFGDISNDKIVDITNRYFELRGIRKIDHVTGIVDGWTCEYNENIAGFKNQPKFNKLLCGKFSVSISWQRFEELMMHEVEDHAMRCYNAKTQGFQSLAYGLPKYEDAEEGWGLISEQLWCGKISTNLARDHFRYLAIAYGAGVVDGTRHSKEETFDFISRFMIIADLGKITIENPVDIESVVKRKRKLAFEHVFRAYRGMPKDRVFFKDTSYLVGKMKILQFLANTNASAAEILNYMQQGKFDPTNQLHLAILQQLGLVYEV